MSIVYPVVPPIILMFESIKLYAVEPTVYPDPPSVSNKYELVDKSKEEAIMNLKRVPFGPLIPLRFGSTVATFGLILSLQFSKT